MKEDEVVKRLNGFSGITQSLGISESWWQAVNEDGIVKRLNGHSAITQLLV